jgi:hypothetical protein
LHEVRESATFDLRKQDLRAANRPFDLAYCFEVAEHLDPGLGDGLVRFCAMQAPLVVFSAAHPGHGGEGHKKEQPQTYWINRFGLNGVYYQEDTSSQLAASFRAERLRSKWLADNVMLFAD